MDAESKAGNLAAKTLSLIFFLFVIAILLMATNLRSGLTATGQDVDKSLDIERYSDEPLEIVELSIREQAIKEKIATQYRNNGIGLDTVNFKAQDGWFRHIQITLRNVSGKPIYGVRAHLYFRPSDTETLFSLPLAGFTHLRQGILEPSADITLTVTEQAWTLTADILKQHGVNPDLAPVSFGIDVVQFSDLQWSKGQILRRDPENPNRWTPTSKFVPS